MLPEHEILGILKDAALTHAIMSEEKERPGHQAAVAALINRMPAGGNSVRRRRVRAPILRPRDFIQTDVSVSIGELDTAGRTVPPRCRPAGAGKRGLPQYLAWPLYVRAAESEGMIDHPIGEELMKAPPGELERATLLPRTIRLFRVNTDQRQRRVPSNRSIWNADRP